MRFKKVSEGLGEVDLKFDQESAEMQDALERAQEAQQDALQEVDSMLGKKIHDDDEFITAEDSPSP